MSWLVAAVYWCIFFGELYIQVLQKSWIGRLAYAMFSFSECFRNYPFIGDMTWKFFGLKKEDYLI